MAENAVPFRLRAAPIGRATAKIAVEGRTRTALVEEGLRRVMSEPLPRLFLL